MSKIKTAKIYVIADTETFQNFRIEEIIEFQMAFYSVRANCYSSQNILNRIKSDERALSWDISNAVTTALINTCNAVIVLGDISSPIALRERNIAQECQKHITCVSEKELLKCFPNGQINKLAQYFQTSILSH